MSGLSFVFIFSPLQIIDCELFSCAARLIHDVAMLSDRPVKRGAQEHSSLTCQMPRAPLPPQRLLKRHTFPRRTGSFEAIALSESTLRIQSLCRCQARAPLGV